MSAGTMMKHARWGGAGCLRACGMNLVECGTLLWCMPPFLGPALCFEGCVVAEHARWGGVKCLWACDMRLVEHVMFPSNLGWFEDG